jgi:hypothetical protein
MPTTPLSPYQHSSRASPGPSQSTMSLASSAASMSPSTIAGGSGSQRGGRQLKKEKSSFFRFAKKSPKSPSIQSPAVEEAPPLPPPPTDDAGISLPWNFQHNIHVDEGYHGLPPSWSASMADAGFTEDEIAAIQARRNAVRSPGSQYLYTERPHSPNTPPRTVPRIPAPPPPIVTHPTPRTSSLPRQSSNASSIRPPGQRPPFSSSQTAPANPGPTRQFSTDSFGTMASSLDAGEPQYAYVGANGQTPSLSRSPSERSSASSSAPSMRNKDRETITSPRRNFRVANASSPERKSPPPAYVLPSSSSRTVYADQKGKAPSNESSSSIRTPPNMSGSPRNHVKQSPRRSAEDDDSDEGNSVESSRSVASSSRGKRLTILPPRLSLHDSDLSSWTEAIISSIPTELSPQTPSSAFATAQAAEPSKPSSSAPNRPYLHATRSAPLPSVPKSAPTPAAPRRPAPKPIPTIVLKEYEEDPNNLPLMSAKTPLWNEIMVMVNPSPSSDNFTPAISETFSPTLPHHREPLSPADSIGYDGVADYYLSAATERDSNRDSNTSTISTVTVTDATIVRDAALATRAVANVVGAPEGRGARASAILLGDRRLAEYAEEVDRGLLTSPMSAGFGSAGSSGSGSGSSSSRFQDFQSRTPTSEGGDVPPKSPVLAYLDSSPRETKSPFAFGPQHSMLSKTDTFGGISGEEDEEEDDDIYDEEDTAGAIESPSKETDTSRSSPVSHPAPLQYPGWLSEVVAPLGEFIDNATDPRAHYTDRREIAEGESGSVFAARVIDEKPLGLSPATLAGAKSGFVAIKNVPILPSGSPKLVDLEKELALMKGVSHGNILTMDALFVDLVEDSLWIRMELMERSLADVVGLVCEGLMVQERMIARFASDALLAMAYLQQKQIAHRDVRSDNFLINHDGVLKITDFSNAVQVTPESPTCSDDAGVIYWQAPEVRAYV